jgi:hypothetical protein
MKPKTSMMLTLQAMRGEAARAGCREELPTGHALALRMDRLRGRVPEEARL